VAGIWVFVIKSFLARVYSDMAEKENTKRNRRDEILQALAQMLESSDGSQRITTAKLAANVGVSEAALYRHFPSKTRMFDSLIEFIEDSLMSRINLILQDEKETFNRLRLILLLVLGFAERNPGLTRIMTGHALMFEQDRLQGRINQLFERIEVQLRQVLREKKLRDGQGFVHDEALLATQLLAFCEGMLSRFVRSEFRYRPTQEFDARWPLIVAQLQYIPLDPR
jgi:TetR/AcrR family transcriptional regulator